MRVQSEIVFVTFPTKVEPSKAKEVLAELRKRFQSQIIFTPRVPRGRKLLLNINDMLVIVTIPTHDKNRQEESGQKEATQIPQNSERGFTLAELAGVDLAKINKVKNKK